jgi:hypothetical protein
VAELQNFKKVRDYLINVAAKKYANSDGKIPSVSVGYTAAYAVYVHENIEMKWKGLPRPKPKHGVYWGPHGQAKFLEQPARELTNDGTLKDLIKQALKDGGDLVQALYVAGLRIQRESMKLVPVDTGNLRRSAFTRKDG